MRLLSFFLIAFAACAAETNQPAVELYLRPVWGSEMLLAFREARGVVEGVYSEIGVRVVWRETLSSPAGCTKLPLHRQIVISFQSPVPAGHMEAAFAFSNPYSDRGPCVTLLMDRLQPLIRLNPKQTGYLLGHVMAHEIGHVLQGIARHSESGVMKAAWSLHETSHMSGTERLRFTPYDAELILDALQSLDRAPSCQFGPEEHRQGWVRAHHLPKAIVIAVEL